MKQYPARWMKGLKEGMYHPPFYISSITPTSCLPPETRSWIRNANDERAAQDKAIATRYNERRGAFAVKWVSSYCYLYEGTKAGQLMDIEDWQYEWFMQFYGWVMRDPDTNKIVRRFTKGNAWIPKKNAKSPTLAANNLYMLIGDGEKGQKCFSVARDGTQALISHRHAEEMVRTSPILNTECRINKTTHEIFHLPSKSISAVLHTKTLKSTEGINGSLFVDETHVVDQITMDMISRAGISRAEPVTVKMSTAGDNADGYGYSEYTLDLDVAAGKIYAPRRYSLDFSCPMDVQPATLIEDPALTKKIIIRTNPTMGRIIRMTEILEDYSQSTRSLTEMSTFARYRINLWTSSTANWLNPLDFDRCQAKFNLTTLAEEGHQAVLGLDMSKTNDMTSLSMAIAVPNDEDEILPHYVTWSWIPESKVNMFLAKGLPIYDWIKQKYLYICKGKVISYEDVISKIVSLRSKFNVVALGYDPYNADVIVDRLANQYNIDPDSELFAVKQTMPYMAPPTAEYERLILSQGMRHNGNPVKRWQVGHVSVKIDPEGNKKPIKPPSEDYRKIDCIVSDVISTAMLYSEEAGITNRRLKLTDHVVISQGT